MAYAILADLTLFLHLAFIVFVVAGGVVLRWRPKLWPVHFVAAAWGAYVALANSICPLTPLEIWFSEQAGSTGYRGGFIEHYLVPLIYPAGLTPGVQRALGVGVVVVNLAVYGWVFFGRGGRHHGSTAVSRRNGGASRPLARPPSSTPSWPPRR